MTRTTPRPILAPFDAPATRRLEREEDTQTLDPPNEPTSAATTASPTSRAEPPRRPTARIRAARIVAVAADLLQIVLFPAFAAGWASPVNDALDVVVAVVMVRLLGWHFAFLPTFVAELVPGVDLIPTWTMAVWLATRGGAAARRA